MHIHISYIKCDIEAYENDEGGHMQNLAGT